jgi:CheY-like chemotaxis protein
VESAELAIDYLQSTYPDVIFMDHLMAGMDGIAAVRIIKANPKTAAIPIFMYTSQHEDAFVHAARIAGALGVLPKTFKQSDVANVLLQVQFAQSNAAIKINQAPTAIVTTFTRAQQISLVALGAALLFCIAALIYSNQQLQQQVTQSQRAVAAAQSASSSAWRSSLHSRVATEPPRGRVVALDSETIPYGEVPLAGSRLERLKSLINGLNAKSFKGVVRIEVFTGDFCLQGSATDGYHVAAADLAIKQCDLLGNPFADVLSVQQRQSSSFSNFVASINQAGNIQLQLADGGRQLATAYPAQMPGLKAGEWNLSAARNNRVEFTVSTE